MADEIKDCADLDAHLTPFVDGEAAPAVRHSVEAHLGKCPPCRKHADAESSAREVVHTHRDELRVEAPAALRARCARLRQGSVGQAFPSSRLPSSRLPSSRLPSSFLRRWVPLSLAATLVLAVAGVFLFGLNNPVQALAASLTLDHAKCFKIGDTDPHTDPAVAAKNWQQEQGWQIVVPQALPSEQLQLVDVRHCYSTDGRAAHLMYRWHGAPLSLYVLPQDTGHAGTVANMGREAVIWCANRRTYAVVAEGQPQDLGRIVDYMKANAR